jgi:hypothetical protein
VISVAPEAQPTDVRALGAPAGRPGLGLGLGLHTVAAAVAVGRQRYPRDDCDHEDQHRRGEGDYRPGHVESSVSK